MIKRYTDILKNLNNNEKTLNPSDFIFATILTFFLFIFLCFILIPIQPVVLLLYLVLNLAFTIRRIQDTSLDFFKSTLVFLLAIFIPVLGFLILWLIPSKIANDRSTTSLL